MSHDKYARLKVILEGKFPIHHQHLGGVLSSASYFFVLFPKCRIADGVIQLKQVKLSSSAFQPVMFLSLLSVCLSGEGLFFFIVYI